MDNINIKSIAKAFLKLVEAEFLEPDEEIRLLDQEIAAVLLDKFFEVVSEYVLIDENENIESGQKNELIDYEDAAGLRALDDKISLEYKQKAVQEYRRHQKTWKFSTFKQRFKNVNHLSDLYRWERQIKIGGTRFQIYELIEKQVLEIFRASRLDFLPVHDMDIKRWGLQAAFHYPGFNFKASDSWIYTFKIRNRIVSRKIQKIVRHRLVRLQENLEETTRKFQSETKVLLEEYQPSHVWNTDQTGFKYEIVSPRTLSNKGERCTFGTAYSPKNKMTHSYTVQYIISIEGKIIGDAYICLQESSGRIGPRVEERLFVAPNLQVSCSKSGKLTTGHVKSFLEKMVVPNASSDLLYIIDKWTGQTDEELYVNLFPNSTTRIKVHFIPESCTDLCQPLDTYFHRQLKFLVKKIYDYALLHENEQRSSEISPRNGILKLQSLVHFLLTAAIFEPMIKYCWFSSGLWIGDRPAFQNAKEVCFDFRDVNCQILNCSKFAFLRCSWCNIILCFHHLFHEYHLMECSKGPFGRPRDEAA